MLGVYIGILKIYLGSFEKLCNVFWPSKNQSSLRWTLNKLKWPKGWTLVHCTASLPPSLLSFACLTSPLRFLKWSDKQQGDRVCFLFLQWVSSGQRTHTHTQVGVSCLLVLPLPQLYLHAYESLGYCRTLKELVQNWHVLLAAFLRYGFFPFLL